MGLDSIFARLMDFSEKGFRASYRACGELVMEKRRGVLYFPIGFSNSKVGEILTDPLEKAIMGLFSIILSSEAPLANPKNPFFSLFHPCSVAVIGASGNPLKMGYQCVLSLKQGSFPGPIYPVHPQEKEILRLAVFTDVRQIPDPVDLAILVVPAAEIFPALEACQKKDTVRCLLDDRNVDALIVFLLHHPFMTPKRIAGPLLRQKQKSAKPIVLCVNSPRGFIDDEVAELESPRNSCLSSPGAGRAGPAGPF